MRLWIYDLVRVIGPDGVHQELRGTEVVWRSGPHATDHEAEVAVLDVMRRWSRRAKETGGDRAIRIAGVGFLFELPDHIEPRGARPWVSSFTGLVPYTPPPAGAEPTGRPAPMPSSRGRTRTSRRRGA